MLKMKLVNRDTEGELRMTGRRDTNTSEDAENYITRAVERFDTLILNMAELEFVSSAGLRVLKRAHLAMRCRGGVLIAKNVSKAVMEVFEITGFAGMLKIIND